MEALLEKNNLMNLAYLNLTFEEVDHFEKLARDFSKKTILPMFEGDHADGDPDRVEDILQKAFEVGIAASTREDMPGKDFGIWGKSVDNSGLLTSLVLLSVIAETCGGIAMCLHAQGLAVNLLQMAHGRLPYDPTRAAICYQEEYGMPLFSAMLRPGEDSSQPIQTTATRDDTGYVLNGVKRFIYSMPDPDTLVVLARDKDSWGCFMVPASSPGLVISDAGHRTGLRASSLAHATFNNVRIALDHRLDDGNAAAMVLRSQIINWIGMTAIAVGIARGAVRQAKTYAGERYQGGTIIQDHPIIKMYIADSEARTRAAKSSVFDQKNINLNDMKSLRTAAMVKLTGMKLCAGAVTDALQVLGGYGYMEDFGMEKRLRDVTVLKSAHGSPLYLKQLIADSERMEA